MYGVRRPLTELTRSLIGCWELHLGNNTSESLLGLLDPRPMGPLDADCRSST
jgi:hypothetical protein